MKKTNDAEINYYRPNHWNYTIIRFPSEQHPTREKLHKIIPIH